MKDLIHAGSLAELCAICGFKLGSHRAGGACFNQCPQHEGRMDWDMKHVTVFQPTGKEKGDE